MDRERYMKRCYELAIQAGKKGFDTFGAVLVHDGAILEEAENTADWSKGRFGHAEFNLVHKCANRYSDAILKDAVLYTSCAPCERCLCAIASLGVGNVVFGVSYEAFSQLTPDDAVPVDREGLLQKLGVPMKLTGPVLEEEGMHVFEWWGGEYQPLDALIAEMDGIKREKLRKETCMNRAEKYRRYFTKEYLMGPNSFRLLDELIEHRPEGARFDRTLDLGCGFALTSIFIANETDAKRVFAFDLWVSATENDARIRDNGLEDRIIPIHGDAMDMPFAHDYFDAVVSVDSYHYFGCKAGVFAEKILPFVKPGGHVMIAIPGLRKPPEGELDDLFHAWAEGDDAQLFHTAEWWRDTLAADCGDTCDIAVREAECFDIAWREWFESGHEYGLRDKEFLEKGLDQMLNFVLIYVRKRP